MSTPTDLAPVADAQEPGDEFPGHCSYCGAPCEACAGRADRGDVPDDY